VAVCAPGLAAARFVSITFLLVMPGALFLGAAAVRPTSGFVRLMYAVASSVLVLLAIALVESVALPPLGIARPLTLGPLLIGVDAATVALLAPPPGRSIRSQRCSATTRLGPGRGGRAVDRRLCWHGGGRSGSTPVPRPGGGDRGNRRFRLLDGRRHPRRHRVPAWVGLVLWSVAVALMFA
jgi:hypothetical protein